MSFRGKQIDRRLYEITGLVLLFLLILSGVAFLGGGSRKQFNTHRVYRVDKPEKALYLWRKLGVRGRTVVFLGQVFTLKELSSLTAPEKNINAGRSFKVSKENFLLLASYEKIARKFYRVVPDRHWARVKKRLAPLDSYYSNGRQIFLTHEGGIPIIFTRLRDIRASSDKALIFIEGSDIKDYGAAGVRKLINNRKMSDVVILRTGTKKRNRQ